MYYLIDINTGKYLTLYGLKIGFTDNLEIAKSFKTVDDAIAFEDFYSNDFDEYTKPKFINLNK